MYETALIFSVVCFVWVTAVYLRSPMASVFHPLTFYLAFHGFVFVLRPLVAYAFDFTMVYRAYQFTPSPEDKLTAIMVSNLGLLVFAAASWRTGNVPMVFKGDAAAQSERDMLTPTFLWIGALCLVVGVYSLLTVWETAQTTGSAFSNMIRDGRTGKAFNDGTSGYLIEAQLLLASCAAIFAWLMRFRLLAIMPLVLFAVYRAGTGGRGVFVTALATMGLLYLYDRRRRGLPLLWLVTMPLLLIAFTTVGDDRGAAIRRAISNDMSSEVFTARREERFLEGMDFANLEYLEYVIYVVPQRSGTYGYFNGVLQVFTEPVPRALWEGKPIDAPFERINMFDYGRPSGMTRSLPGEGWFSLGWLGVVMWCGAWGWVLGLIYRKFVESEQSAFHVAAYLVFVPVLIIAFRDGQLVTVFRQCLFYLAPVIVWRLAARGLGLPSLTDIRAAAARRARSGSDLRGRKTDNPTSNRDEALPPAVLRRRLALGKR